MTIVIEPEFKNLIPPLSEDEYRTLEQNILRDGCREPLVVWGEVLVDGHNRYSICAAHNIEFKTQQIEFESKTHARIWMRANQIGRRNILPAWRIELELANKADLQLIGKAKKEATEGRPSKDKLLSQNDNGYEPEPKHNTRNEIARAAKVSTGQVAMAEVLKKEAPELWNEAKAGSVTISGAYKNANKEKNKKQRKIKEAEEVRAIQGVAPEVMNVDCLSILNQIADVDLLIADPPYFTDGDFTGHIEQCLKRVKPTGQAYVFAGADPQEVRAYLNIKTDMKLEQMLVWNYNNTGQRQPNERYTSNYQVCFYFKGKDAPQINKPADGKEQYACQTINAPDARIGDRYHQWQKPNELISRIIKNSSKEGDFVFDPFVGSGTTVITAALLGRISLGCDIDPEAIDICRDRGCNVIS